MTHYECLGLRPDASRKDIRIAYQRLLEATNPEDNQTLAAIEEAYKVLSDGVDRMTYDGRLEAEPEGLERQKRSFPMQRPYRLLDNPASFNHYDYINRLFTLDEGHEDYLKPTPVMSRL